MTFYFRRRLSKKLECGLPARLYKHLQARMPAFQYHFLDNLLPVNYFKTPSKSISVFVRY